MQPLSQPSFVHMSRKIQSSFIAQQVDLMKNEGEAFGFSHSNAKATAWCVPSTERQNCLLASFFLIALVSLLCVPIASCVQTCGCWLSWGTRLLRPHHDMDAKSLADFLSSLDGDSAVHLILEVLKLRPALSPAVVSFACPALTYAPARGMMERRCRGVVKHVDRSQGFGYIASPEIEATFGMDVVVRPAQLRAFQTGEEVSFTCVLNEENKPQAYEVLTASGMPHPGVAPPEWADWNDWDVSDPKKRRLQ